jgi:UPF0755 protein
MATSLLVRLRGLSIILLTVALTAIGVRTYLQSHPIPLFGSMDGPPIIVFIKPGTSVPDIAQILKDAGVIRSRQAFLALAYLKGSIRRLHAGEYEFNRSMSLLEILRKLEAGRVVTHQVTIPEGFSVEEVARLLAGERLVDPDRFMALATDARLAEKLGIPAASLEGYLFPDTYRLTRGMDEEEILRIMVARFHQMTPPDLEARAWQVHLSLHEVVTLASLIEKEVILDRERPLVAAVFHNRLRRQMPLQSDPTAVYGVPDFHGRIRAEDLRRRSPYNTYLNSGLPPGPIANPGRASLMAALNPARVNFLYFVSKNDGSHVFSYTLDEHNVAVRKYQVPAEDLGTDGS